MVLRRILTYFIVVMFFSVVHSHKIKREAPDFSDIVKNISSVNSLLQNVIKNYKELEKIAKSAEEIDHRTDSEIKQLFDVETGDQGGSFEEKITTKSDKLVRTPIFFSDESWRDGESESLEKFENDKENYDTTPPDLKELTHAGILAAQKDRVKVLGRNFKHDTESNDDNSSDEINRKKINRTFKSKHKHVASLKTKIAQVEKEVQVPNIDDEVVRNEFLRADYLREAYMEACKVVAIRKCRRALRSVAKDVCSGGRKCTGKFKDDFRQNGMSACDLQFTNQTTACRSGVDDDEAEEHSPDSRRLRVFITAKKPANDTSPKHAKGVVKTKNMNVLRDRYERACKKDSFKKCQAACEYSYKNTCKKFGCVKNKSNLFNKSCKRRCKETFGVTRGDGSGSSPSSSSGGSGSSSNDSKS